MHRRRRTALSMSWSIEGAEPAFLPFQCLCCSAFIPSSGLLMSAVGRSLSILRPSTGSKMKEFDQNAIRLSTGFGYWESEPVCLL